MYISLMDDKNHFENHRFAICPGRNSQKLFWQIFTIFVNLGLKIFRFLRFAEVFKTDILIS